MKLTKILLLIACALAVHGCVTWSSYSNPYEPGRGEYTAGAAYDEYAHDSGEPVVDLYVADAAYYPWWSVDYYYPGSHRYRPGYLRGPYSYRGYNFGLPVHAWPYYGYYSPIYYPYYGWSWYDPWAGFPRYGIGLDFPWLDVYWSRRYPEDVNDPYGPAYSQHDNRSNVYPVSHQEMLTDARDRAAPGNELARRQAQPISRQVWVAPSMNEAGTNMEVRSRRERKIQESHIGPAPVQPSASARPTAPAISAPPQNSSAPVASAPGMMRDVLPSQPSFASPRRQANPAPMASPPPISRTIQSPPSMPAPIRGPSDSGAGPTPKGGDRNHN